MGRNPFLLALVTTGLISLGVAAGVGWALSEDLYGAEPTGAQLTPLVAFLAIGVLSLLGAFVVAGIGWELRRRLTPATEAREPVSID